MAILGEVASNSRLLPIDKQTTLCSSDHLSILDGMGICRFLTRCSLFRERAIFMSSRLILASLEKLFSDESSWPSLTHMWRIWWRRVYRCCIAMFHLFKWCSADLKETTNELCFSPQRDKSRKWSLKLETATFCRYPFLLIGKDEWQRSRGGKQETRLELRTCQHLEHFWCNNLVQSFNDSSGSYRSSE